MKVIETLPRIVMPESREKVFPSHSCWPYLVHDFLEMRCHLNDEDRNLLVEELRVLGCQAQAIDLQPAFSIDSRLITVLSEAAVEEHWLFDPRSRKIERYPLRKKK